MFLSSFGKKFAKNFESLLAKLPWSSKPDHSLAFLNVSQFLGVLNDNIYKLVLIFFLIDLQGVQNAGSILSAVGAIFVIPFLLFSSYAGMLADRFSKSRLIIFIKAIEIITFTLVLFAFVFTSSWAGYVLLFLLSTHSALFGPSKYGIIPELVAKQNISKANGLITSFTYLAMIFGTFLASFLTELTNRRFSLIAAFCLFLAICGFLTSLYIRYTPPRGRSANHSFFLKEILKTIIAAKKQDHLLIAMSSSSFFLFIGAFTQLNIIPYAIEMLRLTEVSGGYLFLAAAIGIALGAFFAGRISKKTIELGLSCLGSFFISLIFFLLAFFPHNLYGVIVLLFFLGIAGGCLIVPFDSFIQLASPDERRGHNIAATNFLSFCGVLVASFAIYFFSKVLHLSSAGGFAMIGLLTLLFALFLWFKLSAFLLHFASKVFITPFYSITKVDEELTEKRGA